METYKELKDFCDEKIKEYPEHEKKYKKEIIIAKRFYDNGRNLYEELSISFQGLPWPTDSEEEFRVNKKFWKTGKIDEKNKIKDWTHPPKISTRYIIPFLLGFTKEVTDEPFDYIQVKPGASGGVDVDCDFSTFAKEKVQEYLINKFGEECVVNVGTFTRLGPPSAAKDLLRIYKTDYKASNDFTKCLDTNMNWEDNLNNLKTNYPAQYQFYEEHKEILDMTPHFINKVRQGGKHAGGVVILPGPVYDYIPVDRVQGVLVSAFPESASNQVLDELGIVKYDILAISILDVIRNAIDMIDEKLYLVEENNIKKIVPESYIDGIIEQL
ncbi:MAG TPA: hypothetical protein VMZ91_00530 [Candidatus Paceibacterota bacterium]|nr:hypothetical protein [Candidatus Paceibacterota bacterium]